MSVAATAVKQYATFVVAGRSFGIEVGQVQEVLREQEVTPVPFAPGAVEGLINLRGQIVPALNLKALLKLPHNGGEAVPPSIVVRAEEGVVCLLVDEVLDVRELDEAECEAPPLNLDAELAKLIRGVYTLDDRLLMVLDAVRATSHAAVSRTTTELNERN